MEPFVSSAATTQKGWLMPKILCLVGMAAAILVFLIFLIDLICGLSGATTVAPLRYSSLVMDIIFLVASGALGYVGFTTFREQK